MFVYIPKLHLYITVVSVRYDKLSGTVQICCLNGDCIFIRDISMKEFRQIRNILFNERYFELSKEYNYFIYSEHF